MDTDFDAEYYADRKEHLQRIMRLTQFALQEQTAKDATPTKKAKKVHVSQGTTLSQMNYFAKHLSVTNPSANASHLRRYWKKEEGDFPAKLVGDWFDQYRKKFRQNVVKSFNDMYKDVETFTTRTTQQDTDVAKEYMAEQENVTFLFEGVLPADRILLLDDGRKEQLEALAVKVSELVGGGLGWRIGLASPSPVADHGEAG